MKAAALPWANLLVYVASVGSGYIHYNGKSISDVSANYPTIITPAGFAFAIWGLIYLSVGVYTVWQLLPKASGTPYPGAVSVWYLVACICQTLWTPAWCFELFPLSGLLMLGIWISLFAVNINLFRLRNQESSSFWASQAVSFPFAVWFGWITAASIINTTVILRYSVGSEFFGSALWGGLALTIATSFALVWGGVSFSWGYCFTLAWAAYGIYASNPPDAALRIIAASVSGGLIFFGVGLLILTCLSYRLFKKVGIPLPLPTSSEESCYEGPTEMHTINDPLQQQPQRSAQFFFAQPVVFPQRNY